MRRTLGQIAHIGTLNEGSLHAALKERYAASGDRFEVEMDGFVVDIVRGDDLIEIQTGSFGALGRKLDVLLCEHRVLVVHPIAATTTLVRPQMADRRSPRKGHLYDVFDELVSVPTLLDHPNFSLEVVMVAETRVKVHDPKLRRRRGGWRTVDRRLDEIVETHRFDLPSDVCVFLPDGLPDVFTTADMASRADYGRATAQRVAYCLRALGCLDVVDRTRGGYHYRRTD